jgi:hypothetical protein
MDVSPTKYYPLARRGQTVAMAAEADTSMFWLTEI